MDRLPQLAAVEMLPAFLQQHPGVKLVVLDSVTFHFRQHDPGDMAARTRQLAHMAQQLMQLAGERDVAVRGRGRCRCSAAAACLQQ